MLRDHDGQEGADQRKEERDVRGEAHGEQKARQERAAVLKGPRHRLLSQGEDEGLGEDCAQDAQENRLEGRKAEVPDRKQSSRKQR